MSAKKYFLISSLIIITSICGTAVAADEWPMFHHDLALSGCSTSSGPDTNAVLWIYNTNTASLGGIKSSPALAGEVLYIGALDSRLYAINAIDGSLIWSFNADGIINSSPAVADGKVYFLSEGGTLYALDADTSGVVWQVQVGNGPYDWSSPAVHNGNVFVASSTGHVISLNASTGGLNWNTSVGGHPDGPIAVVNGKVYSGTHNLHTNNSPTLVALDEITGEIIWTYDYYLYHGGGLKGGMVNSNGPAVVDGDGDGNLEIYFGVYIWLSKSNQAVCLDEANGAEKWTASIGGNSTSTPAVHNGRVFIGSDDGKVYALDAGTGAYICSFETGAPVLAAPAVADGKVFFGSLDHIFYAIDETTCELIWSYNTLQSRLMGSPAVAYGIVYVGNENGKIYAFGPPSCLTLEKTDDVNDGDCVEPGHIITYTIDYNFPGGPNCPNVIDVNIIDYLPAGVSFLSASGGVYHYNDSGTVTWYIGTLYPGDAGSVTLTVLVTNPQSGGTITNPCEIINSNGQILKTAYEYTPVCCYDPNLLMLTKVDDVNDGDCVDPNREITYTINYSYPAGPNCPDLEINIIDYLPYDVNFISASGNGYYYEGTRQVRWPIIGHIHPGDFGYVTLTVQTKNPQPGTTLTNRCEIISGNGQILKTAYEYTPVCCHHTITKVVKNEVPFKKITYEICYDANGCECNNVEINDVLPSCVDFNSASDGGVPGPSRTVTWYIGNLGPYDKGCVTLTVDINNHSDYFSYWLCCIDYITNCCKMTSDCMDSVVTACVTTDWRAKAVTPFFGKLVDPNDQNDGGKIVWKPGVVDCNLMYHVYFGTNYDDVNDANTSSPVYKGEVDVNWYYLGAPLSYDTIYYWRIDQVDENQPDSPPWKGEIWQFTTISIKAHNPLPVHGATALSEPLQLSWTAGALAKSTNGHRVFFGTSYNQANLATTATAKVYRGTVSNPSYSMANLYPDWTLVPNTTYYWRIDEVNDPCVWKGPVWNFTPATYTNIDDFEDYNSTDDVNANWTEGYTLTGCPDATGNAGRALIRDATGKHLRCTYHNGGSGVMAFSETKRSYSGGASFAGGGVLSPSLTTLRIDYLGAALNSVDPVYDRMYVAIEDTAGNVSFYDNPDGNAAQVSSWTSWYSKLTDINAAGLPNPVNLQAISSLAIGFGVRCTEYYMGSGTGDGNVMFDNIRLYSPTCVPQFGPTADFDEDCAVNLNDLAFMALYWLTDCTPPRDCPMGQPMIDIHQDYIIDFKDLAILGNQWRTEKFWP